MTYNFDPDRWFENERLRIEMKQRSGEWTAEETAAALEEAERRYEAMLERLDGTFPVGARRQPLS
jgi:hypothetical protein